MLTKFCVLLLDVRRVSISFFALDLDLLFKIGNQILNTTNKLDTQVILHNSFVEQIGISSCMIRLTILDNPFVGKINISKLQIKLHFMMRDYLQT